MTDTDTLLNFRDKIQTFQHIMKEETELSPEQLENQLLALQKDLIKDPTLVKQLEVTEIETLVQAMKILATTPLPKPKSAKKTKSTNTEPFSLEELDPIGKSRDEK